MSQIVLGIANFILENAGVIIGVALVVGIVICIINFFKGLG